MAEVETSDECTPTIGAGRYDVGNILRTPVVTPQYASVRNKNTNAFAGVGSAGDQHQVNIDLNVTCG